MTARLELQSGFQLRRYHNDAKTWKPFNKRAFSDGENYPLGVFFMEEMQKVWRMRGQFELKGLPGEGAYVNDQYLQPSTKINLFGAWIRIS